MREKKKQNKTKMNKTKEKIAAMPLFWIRLTHFQFVYSQFRNELMKRMRKKKKRIGFYMKQLMSIFVDEICRYWELPSCMLFKTYCLITKRVKTAK